MSCCHSNTIQLYYKFLVGRDGLVAAPSQANINALDILRADNTWGPPGGGSADIVARSQIVSAVLQDSVNFSNVASSNASQSMLISTADSKAVSAASGGGGGGGGSGDVVGPSGAVADRVAVFNGTTGKLLKDSGAIALNGVATSAGSGDSGKVPLLDVTGKLDASFIPGGGGGGGGSAPTVVTAAYAATLTTDASQAAGGSSLVVQVGTLTGNITISNPTNPTNRQRLEFVLKQDATGGRTLTLGNKFRFPSSSVLTSPISAANSTDFAAANKKTLLLCEYDSTDDKWSVVSFVPGY